MDLWGFVNQYKTNDSKQANLTSIKGGKWNIPPEKVKQFYKELLKAHNDGEVLPPFAEKIGDEHPLIFDLDIKYKELFETRQYSLSTLQLVTEFLWASVREVIDMSDMDDLQNFNEVYVKTKQKPYPCKKGTYKSKDGFHIVFPKIIIKRDVYKLLCNLIRDKQDTLFGILKDTCENPPSNLDDTLIDASFSRWMPYLCKKEGEEPYLLEEVFVMSLNSIDRKNPELVKGPLTFYTPEVLMMELSMIRSNIKENVSYTELIQNKLKSKSSNSSNMVTNDESDDIYKSYHPKVVEILNTHTGENRAKPGSNNGSHR